MSAEGNAATAQALRRSAAAVGMAFAARDQPPTTVSSALLAAYADRLVPMPADLPEGERDAFIAAQLFEMGQVLGELVLFGLTACDLIRGLTGSTPDAVLQYLGADLPDKLEREGA